MIKLQCENCGGRINPVTLRCEYCRTQYQMDNDRLLKVEMCHNPIKVYASQICVPSEIISNQSDEVADYALYQLAHSLSDAIAKNMDLQIESMPSQNAKKITARVRIVEPQYVWGM